VSISRISQPERNNYGYYVRVTRNGKQHAKFFSDAQQGGKRKALRAAREHEGELLESLPPVKKRGRMTSRNSSGKVGVSRSSSTRKGHEYEYWQAAWSEGDEKKSVKFSVGKYGEERARRMAIKARRDWEKQAAEAK
jgi:hypothetical protein